MTDDSAHTPTHPLTDDIDHCFSVVGGETIVLGSLSMTIRFLGLRVLVTLGEETKRRALATVTPFNLLI